MIKTTQTLLKYKTIYHFCHLRNLYQTLGVKESSSFKEIKEKYLQKSKVMHPDQSTSSTDQYHQVQEAYKILISPEQRKKYDLSLGIRNSPWQRELNSSFFSEKFESQYYDQILKQENIKVKVTHLSLQERLQKQFEKEIGSFKARELFKSGTFIIGLFGIGLMWLMWSSLQIFLINYSGTQEHKVESAKADKAFRSLPTFTR